MNGQEERAARRPFSSVPDIETYYPSLSAEAARSHLFRALDRGEGPAFLFGETGLGKTLLCRLLADQFEMDAPVLFLSSARIASRKSFFLHLLFQLHTEPSANADEDELRVRFYDHLRHSDYSRYVLLVDNGDTLPFAVLDEVRSLLDMEYYGTPRFRVALSGTSRFEERLNAPRFASFAQRIACRAWLEPFTRDETADYIARQMKRAAEEYGGLTFSSDAAKLVHKLADGVPRLINQVCDLTLYLSASSEKEIPAKSVQKAWNLLQQIPDDENPDSAEETVSRESAAAETNDEDVVEFGTLDDDSKTEETAPAALLEPSASETAEIGETTEVETDSEIIEFGSLEDEKDPEEEISSLENEEEEAILPFRIDEESEEEDGEISKCETVTMDGNHVEWQAESKTEEGEDWDADEIIDETGADLTYDSMIRQKLLRAFPEETPQTEPETETESDAVSADDIRSDITGCSDHYMEELRLMEIEVSQEIDVIRKLRQMHSGLNSFQAEQSAEPVDETHEKKTEKRSKSPAKRPFLNVFEKIYSDRDKK